MKGKKEAEQLDEIGELIWIDPQKAWHEAQKAYHKYKSSRLSYLYAKAQMLVYIISHKYRLTPDEPIDPYKLKKYFEEKGYLNEAGQAVFWIWQFSRNATDMEAYTALEKEYDTKYAATANEDYKLLRALSDIDFKMMRELDKTRQLDFVLQAEATLRANFKNTAFYRANLATILQQKAEALSHTAETEKVHEAINEALKLVEVPGTSPYSLLRVLYFKGNVAAIAGRNEEALETYYKIVEKLGGNPFYDSLLMYVYIQIFKQLNDMCTNHKVSNERKAELIAGQTKYLNLAKSLLPGQNRPYMVTYILLSEARFMRLTGNYEQAIKNLAKALRYFSKVNIINHVIDVYEEAYKTYEGWAERDQSPALFKKVIKTLKLAHELTYKYNQTEGKEKMSALINKYELNQKELNEKLLQQKMEAMNKEIQLTAISLHEKVKVLDELKSFITSLEKKNKESNQLIKSIAQRIDTVIITEQDKSNLQQKIDESNKPFFRVLANKYPELTSLEIHVCGLFKSGLTNKELSKLYGQNVRSYEQHRYRIKKKMGLGATDNLVKHLLELDDNITLGKEE